jgi:hypothetical protein
MSQEEKKPGVPGAQKKNSYVATKEGNAWKIVAPDGTVVQSGLNASQASDRVKELNQ